MSTSKMEDWPFDLPEEKHYLVSSWGDRVHGRYSACEDFNTPEEAEKGIESLLKDHSDATWMLIYGKEIKRG